MPVMQTTRRLLTAYSDREQWGRDHDEAQSCLDVEERLAWGVHLFRGLVDLEARAQAHALKKPNAETIQLLEMMPLLYQVWTDASEFYLTRAREFLARGYEIEGLEQFREIIEGARCLIGNLGLEEQIRPIEELMSRSRPENPRPDRYGD